MTRALTSADLLTIAPVIPVVVIDDIALAVPLAETLLAGGLPIIEITLRTPVALDAIRLIAEKVPDMVVGAGTVTSAERVRRCEDAGARFLVSPGTTSALLDELERSTLPFLPGVASPSEVMNLLDRGHTVMKLFPAEAVGGRALLKSIAAPLPEARFCPTGGITAESAPLYLALPNVGCVGGTWLTPAQALANRDWPSIQRLATDAASINGHI